MWILDDLTPLREWSSALAGKTAHLFQPPPAIRWEYRSSYHEKGAGKNPPEGAVLSYALKRKPEGEIKMEILDSSGGVVRTFTSVKEPPEFAPGDPDAPEEPKEKTVLTTDPGVQRVTWDLTTQNATKIKGGKQEGNPEAAPRVGPGAYSVKLTVEGSSVTTSLEVRPDPRLAVPATALEEQIKFAREVQDRVCRLTALVGQIRSVREQVQARSAALKDSPRAAEWTKAAQDLVAKCDALEDKVHSPKAQVEYDILAKGARLDSRLAPLLSHATNGSGAPTQGMREVFAGQSQELERYEAEWKALVAGAVADLTKRGRDLSLGDVVVPEPALPAAAGAKR